jgi:LmbE family N-acetylglucosaminyl deacetylase
MLMTYCVKKIRFPHVLRVTDVMISAHIDHDNTYTFVLSVVAMFASVSLGTSYGDII